MKVNNPMPKQVREIADIKRYLRKADVIGWPFEENVLFSGKRIKIDDTINIFQPNMKNSNVPYGYYIEGKEYRRWWEFWKINNRVIININDWRGGLVPIIKPK